MDYISPQSLAPFFDTLNQSNMQRRVTGNLQYDKDRDVAVYSGYWDAAMKNRLAEEHLGLQQQAEKRSKAEQMYQQQWAGKEYGMANKALRQSNLLGWGQLGAQALGNYQQTQALRDYYGRGRQQQGMTGYGGEWEGNIPGYQSPALSTFQNPAYNIPYTQAYMQNLPEGGAPDYGQALNYQPQDWSQTQPSHWDFLSKIGDVGSNVGQGVGDIFSNVGNYFSSNWGGGY